MATQGSRFIVDLGEFKLPSLVENKSKPTSEQQSCGHWPKTASVVTLGFHRRASLVPSGTSFRGRRSAYGPDGRSKGHRSFWVRRVVDP